jgi:hypothetical protein
MDFSCPRERKWLRGLSLIAFVLFCLPGCTQAIVYVAPELTIDNIPGRDSLFSSVQVVVHAPTDVAFVYTSSDTSIATVSSSGLVTPVAGGTVDISISAAGYAPVETSLTFNDVALVGTWVYTKSISTGPTANIASLTWTFSSDGTYSCDEVDLNATITSSGRWISLNNATLRVDHEHSYSIAGSVLTMDGFLCLRAP